MKLKYTTFLFLLIFLLRIDYAQGQVLIGEGNTPLPGAIIQLQNLPTDPNNASNANKGLLFPRVELTDTNNLFPMFSKGYNKAVQDPAHTGLLVFNTNDNLFNGDGQGLYVWHGDKWKGLGLTPRTINIDPKIVYLTKNSPTGKAKITPSVEGLVWKESVSGNLDSSILKPNTNGDKSIMSFERSNTIFGNKTYTFTLENNPDRTTELQVANLELIVNTPLLKVGVGPEDGLVNSKNAVTAYGGQEKWEVLSYSKDVFNWDIPPKLEDGKLTFQLGAAKKPGNVDGQITVGHIDDPNLKGTITVRQNSDFIRLPDFDYIVASIYAEYGGPNSHHVYLCLTSEIRESGNPDVDLKFVGYMSYDADHHEPEILYDRYAPSNSDPSKKLKFLSTSKHDEGSGVIKYALLDLKTLVKDILKNDNNREFKFQSRATWFWPKERADDDRQNQVMVTYDFYKGGKLWFNDRYLEKSPDAKLVKTFVKSGIHVRKATGKDDILEQSDRDRLTQPLYEVEYDIIENSGIFIPMQ